jgi:amino-acid N-acetyltransferase
VSSREEGNVGSATETEVAIRPATKNDIQGIIDCIQPFVLEGKVLPRTLGELEDLIGNYVVAECEGNIVGCAVLEIYSRKLAEVRSLVVMPQYQRFGLGKRLVDACLEKAKNEEILEVMAITSRASFFQSCGFDYTLPGEKVALFYVASPHLLVKKSQAE